MKDIYFPFSVTRFPHFDTDKVIQLSGFFFLMRDESEVLYQITTFGC